jgi:uncharacterized membrane protein HdeD (DUF308 family)
LRHPADGGRLFRLVIEHDLGPLAELRGAGWLVLGAVSLVDAFEPPADSGTRTLAALLGMLGLIAGLVVLRRPGETLRGE